MSSSRPGSPVGRPVTSALPVTPPAARAHLGHRSKPGPGSAFTRPAGDGTAGDGTDSTSSEGTSTGAASTGAARVLRGVRGSRGDGRAGRARKTTSSTSTAPTRYTVRREDGRVNYAFTDPAARQPTGGSTAVRPVPAKAFSGRLLALALVLVTITILLAPTVRTWLGQRAEISSLQQSIQDERAKQSRLKDQLNRWNDPAYVKQQARDRLFYVMPGETGYLVIGAGSPDEVPPVATSAESDNGPQPWLDALWTSVRGAADQQNTR
ncbi:hypothetical protein BKD30_10310 [Tersicoccus phoenicis]|uniref:Septum formation initiator n=1 Tax=Tersicoccus phoenicis TaxID=554083 RepID=A0A1R1L8P3_9MICC|nr:hypothetical protein BKD30_10310 [Tersicoccus phoenicis]